MDIKIGKFSTYKFGIIWSIEGNLYFEVGIRRCVALVPRQLGKGSFIINQSQFQASIMVTFPFAFFWENYCWNYFIIQPQRAFLHKWQKVKIRSNIWEIQSYQSLNRANSCSRGLGEKVKKGKPSKCNPWNDEQVKSSPAPKIWSHPKIAQ